MSAARRAARARPRTRHQPAGRYRLDKTHASLVFKVDHIGFSNYTGQFRTFDANLDFNPQRPEAMAVTATIDPASLDIPAPPAGFLDELKSAGWLDAAGFPDMTFRSTHVTLTAPNAARVDGELKRSAFGITFGLPTPDQPLGVGDVVSFEIEAEFNGPPSP